MNFLFIEPMRHVRRDKHLAGGFTWDDCHWILVNGDRAKLRVRNFTRSIIYKVRDQKVRSYDLYLHEFRGKSHDGFPNQAMKLWSSLEDLISWFDILTTVNVLFKGILMCHINCHVYDFYILIRLFLFWCCMFLGARRMGFAWWCCVWRVSKST